MTQVFLSNGQACYLKETIGDKFIVNKIFNYESIEDGFVEVVDEFDTIVSKIFPLPPTESISLEVKKLFIKKAEIQDELTKTRYVHDTLKAQINNIQKTIIANDKFIINRNELINAKSISFFVKDSIAPQTMVKESGLYRRETGFRGLKLQLEFTLLTGGERIWGANLYFDQMPYSQSICDKFGILIDKTPEEIIEIAKKRVQEIEFTDSQIANCSDEYLPESFIERKKAVIHEQKIKTLQLYERQAKELQEKIDAIKIS